MPLGVRYHKDFAVYAFPDELGFNFTSAKSLRFKYELQSRRFAEKIRQNNESISGQ
jgi:hypothetical protein